MRANLISTKVSASHRKSREVHARPGQTESQVDTSSELACTCHIVKLVENLLKGKAPSYFFKYFQLRGRNIHGYDMRNENKYVSDMVKLESTRRALFFKDGCIDFLLLNTNNTVGWTKRQSKAKNK